MAAKSSSFRGFTIVELMITLVVMVVLLMIALPSFQAYRQRAAVRAAANQVAGLWQQARFEAAKRNAYVSFGITTSGSNFCIGLATQALVGTAIPNATNASQCNCFETDNTAATYCNVARFPTDQTTAGQAEWRGVTLYGTPTIGDTGVVAIIEPKNSTLTAGADAGAITLAAPSGPRTYRLNLRVDALGRGIVCQSSTSSAMSDFANSVCSP